MKIKTIHTDWTCRLRLRCSERAWTNPWFLISLSLIRFVSCTVHALRAFHLLLVWQQQYPLLNYILHFKIRVPTHQHAATVSFRSYCVSIAWRRLCADVRIDDAYLLALFFCDILLQRPHMSFLYLFFPLTTTTLSFNYTYRPSVECTIRSSD